MILNRAITSSSSFSERMFFYSDTSCSTEIATVGMGYTGLTIGDNVTNLKTSITNSSGTSTYPGSAHKVTFSQTCMNIKPSTDDGVIFIDQLLSGVSKFEPKSGTRYECGITGSTKYALWYFVDNSTTGTGLDSLVMEESHSDYPDNWSSPDTYTKCWGCQ